MAACRRDLKYRAPSESIASGYETKKQRSTGAPLFERRHFIFNGEAHAIGPHQLTEYLRDELHRPGDQHGRRLGRVRHPGRRQRQAGDPRLQPVHSLDGHAKRSNRRSTVQGKHGKLDVGRGDVGQSARAAGQRGTDPTSITLPSSSPVSTASASLLFSESFYANWAQRLPGIDRVPLSFVDPGQRPEREIQRVFDRDRCPERSNQISRFPR